MPATLSWLNTTCGGTLPDIVFSRQDIIDNLREVAEILGASGQAQTRLIVVGGSYMALHGLREATRDVDTITVLDSVKTQHKIRLAGIGAPELGQPGGRRSEEVFPARL